MIGEEFSDLWQLMSGPTELRRGWVGTIRPANPAAGAGFSHTVGNTYWERIIGVTATLSTSVAVANRFAQLVLADADGTAVLTANLNTAIAASSTDTLNGYIGASAQGTIAGNNANAAIPDIVLRPGWSYSLAVFNMDAADQLSAITFLVERYPSNWASGTIHEDRERLIDQLLGQLAGRG